MIEIKTPVKKVTKKKVVKKRASKKVAKKKAAKKPKPSDLELPEIDLDNLEVNIDELTGDALDDENKRAMIRARNQQAAKQERLNQVAMGDLVERAKAIDSIKSICLGLNEKLTNFPDKMVTQLHKRSKQEIRDKLVKEIDLMKADFIELIKKGI